MTPLTIVVLGILAASAAIALAALVRGPSAADRMVALDLLLLILAGGAAVGAAAAEDPTLLIVLVVVSLVAFVGTAAVARIIEQRGEIE